MDIEPGDAVHAYGLGIAFVEGIENDVATLAHNGERKRMHVTGLEPVKGPSAVASRGKLNS